MSARPQGYYLDRIAGLRGEWGGRCVACGVRHGRGAERLEFAHLPGKPTGLNGRGRGLAKRYHNIRKYPECYVLLCRRDHLALDAGAMLPSGL